MSMNWHNLRPWSGSQNTAFEELCRQLARYEQAPPGSTFTPKGAPDAGVECFWRLPNGDEWGWQAKFFRSTPGSSQWRQLNDSVRKALEKHPRLTRYTICLPIDRQDPRIDDQEWFMDKWETRVKKWQGWAQEKGMSVHFDYWGQHEAWERLTREEHRGRHLFWFNEELFSQQWLENTVEEAVANAGPRYTPDLDVQLPVARLFDGLGRTSQFYNRVKVLYGKIKRAYAKARSRKAEEPAKEEFDSLQETLSPVLSILESIEGSEVDPINWDCIAEFASKSRDIAWQSIQTLKAAAEQERTKASRGEEEQTYGHPEDFGYERYYLHDLVRGLESIQDLAASSEARLSNTAALLLVGHAGTGKTHLFCDVAKQRVRLGLPTVLLLGGHFRDEEPWLQIIRLLGLRCTREEFLGALEAIAQARDAKALILIDALNEGEARMLWNKHLAGMLTIISRYPWVGIAFSVRTSYEGAVIPQDLMPDRLVREVHFGFADHEYQATRTFFDYFGIERPSVPLLVPEFQNPLFLKLFCQGLKKRGLTRMPPGLRGVTTIFNFFVESINEKLSGREYLDFDPKRRIVQKVVERLAQVMADRGTSWLAREEAQTTVDAILPPHGYERSLLRHLVSEGLLAVDRFRIGDSNWCDAIHFSYDRFTDHLIARCLLDKDLDSMNPSHSFSSERPLGSLVKDEGTCWRNRGLIEAFSVQLPERINKELAEVAPGCADFHTIREAFVDSLIWRDPKAITDGTLQYVNEHVIRYEDTHDQFLNALLTVASIPEHPYNADFLHRHLTKDELAERDAWWSIFLHYQYGERGPADRLVDWAWSAHDRSHIDDESIRLCGVALAWFLTTSNRFLRDRATKALVSLLADRMHVLRQIIREFLGVNDPYVLERLFAVAYGCAMRSMDDGAIGELAQDIYEWIFRNGEPPTHILLRHYARGVVEVALHRGIKLAIDVDKVKPPYGSEWPSEIPTEEELKEHGEWREDMPDEEWARVSLYDSVMGSGDFARYIIGTNFGLFEWSSRRLGEPRKPSRRETYETFVQSLTARQQKAWKRYHNVRINVDYYRRSDEARRIETFGDEFNEEELEGAIGSCEQSFRKTLGKKKLKVLEEHVLPYLDDPDSRKDEFAFDLSLAQRWILQRVLDLGWTVECFGRFDRKVALHSSYGREANKPERIGKKYQWIAYHEFLARVSDNFEFRGSRWSDRPEEYEGPWQIGPVRDIDPSCLLRRTERETWGPYTKSWWFPSSYNAWDSERDNAAWLRKSEDLPAIEPLIEVRNPEDNSIWFAMEAFYRWEEPTPPEEERFKIPRREIWYMLKSYIVKKSEMEALFDWAKKQNFMGRWMPESHAVTGVFLGEFFWAPAVECDHQGWTRGCDNRIPQEVLVATDQYMWGRGGYDCSIEDTIRVHLPAMWLVDLMGLRWNGVEGHFFDDKGNLTAFDPSIGASGPGALLMNRDALLGLLNDNDYDVLWTILGEKTIIGGGIPWPALIGWLQISGAYRIDEKKVDGVRNTRFVSPEMATSLPLLRGQT